jgi:hypothetical protein
MYRSRVAASAALERETEVALRFWWLTSCPVAADRCWHWLGPTDRHGIPVFRIRRHYIDPVRVAWRLVMGEFPLTGYLRPRCGNAHCLRPTHLVWHMSHRARARASSMYDGYVHPSEGPTPAMELDALRRGRALSGEGADRAAS